MPLYILERINDHTYDEYDSKIVRALNEKQARSIANESTGDEGKIWHLPAEVKCKTLLQEGPTGEILGSFNAG